MTPTDRFKINTSRVSYETIDGEVLIINFETGNYYSLLGSAAEIWSIVERGAAAGDILAAVDHRYTGDRGHMEGAINKFVDALLDEALIVHENGDATERTAEHHLEVEANGDEERPVFEVPVLNKYTDVQDLLVLDPIHEVDETGWPTPKVSVEE
jgi:Coenzyme PQQ synthesis protein D (PqqD)